MNFICYVTTGSVLDIEKNTLAVTSARKDSPELEFVPENSAVSGLPSKKPGGSSTLSPGLEIDQTVEVPFGHGNLVIKDIQGEFLYGNICKLKV